MGKKGHLTFEKRALNIQSEVRPYPSPPPGTPLRSIILFPLFCMSYSWGGRGDNNHSKTMNLNIVLNLRGFFEFFLFNFLQFQIKLFLETLFTLKPKALNCF